MIRIVSSRRLEQCESAVAAAYARVGEVRGDADRAMARHVKELADAAQRLEKAQARTGVEELRADLAEADVKRLRDEVTELLAEVRCGEQVIAAMRAELAAAVNTPAKVFILLHRGDVHSVHASMNDAKRAAANDLADPASVTGWVSSPPDSTARWQIRTVGVHGCSRTVHDTGSPTPVGGGHGG